MIYPTAIERDGTSGLVITWSDGERRRYTARGLRGVCPCATCREKRSQPADPLALPILSPAQAQPLTIAGMEPLGNYAYAIHFSDGHDTGIFAFDFLLQLGEAL